MKLDSTTAGVECGRFARAAVEINLAKHLVSMVKIRHMVQKIMFEGLHVICFECGEVGHRSGDCHSKREGQTTQIGIGGDSTMHGPLELERQPEKAKLPARTEDIPERYVHWMMVQRRNPG